MVWQLEEGMLDLALELVLELPLQGVGVLCVVAALVGFLVRLHRRKR